MPWLEVSSDTVMEANMGYIVSGGGTVTLTLPTNLSVGDIIEVRQGADATGWKLVPGAAGQTIEGHEGIFTAGKRLWADLAVSADGQKVAAADHGGYIHTSSDGGQTWTERSALGKQPWSQIACSSDGQKLVTAARDGYIYTSDDGGQNWSERRSAGARYWIGIAVSGDGQFIVAGEADGYVYTSSDGGTSWIPRTAAGKRYWPNLTISADGQYLTSTAGNLTISNDGGQTWTEPSNLPSSSPSVAVSGDGQKLFMAYGGDRLYISNDAGKTWIDRLTAGLAITSLASSSNGQTLIGVAQIGDPDVFKVGTSGSHLVTSQDGGMSWRILLKNGSLDFLSCDSSCSIFLGRRPLGGKSVIYSSALSTTFSEISMGELTADDSHLKLIYVGNGVFSKLR
jgi:photosystem II stability/assembly factor-like uncharacterized protein